MSLDSAAVLQRSSLQEILNEHQSNRESRPTQRAPTLIIPQREAPERWVAVKKKKKHLVELKIALDKKVQQYSVITAISDSILPC